MIKDDNIGVNQWMLKSVKSTLMFIGSNSVWLAMQGLFLFYAFWVNALFFESEFSGQNVVTKLIRFQVCKEKIGRICVSWEPVERFLRAAFRDPLRHHGKAGMPEEGSLGEIEFEL